MPDKEGNSLLGRCSLISTFQTVSWVRKECDTACSVGGIIDLR